MAGEIVRYKASDGVDVELTPEKVIGLIATGGQQPDPRDVVVFMAKCQARGLNPLAGDCYMTTYKSKQTGRVTTSVVVSKDYYMRTAYMQPTYKGFKAGVIVANNGQMYYRDGAFVIKGEQILGGWAEVYDDRLSQPVREEVSFEEYDTGMSLWADKPATMIRKVALVQALREAYPQAYGGIYDQSEMPQEIQVEAIEKE
jgi:phage recombination protein Bet